jgi:hypothetical protein
MVGSKSIEGIVNDYGKRSLAAKLIEHVATDEDWKFSLRGLNPTRQLWFPASQQIEPDQ